MSIDIPICLILIVASFWLYRISLDYVGQVGFFPRLVLICIIALSVVTIIETLIKTRQAPSKKKILEPSDLISLLAVAIFSLSFALLLNYMGLPVAVFVMMPLYMAYLGCRSLKTIIASCCIFYIFIYGMFIFLLKVPLEIWPFFMR